MSFTPLRGVLVIYTVIVMSASIQMIYAEKEPVEDEIIKTDSITQASVTLTDMLLESPTEISLTGFFHGFVASLSVIVVSEIGDKTFFIAAIMAMKHSRLTVFLGAISALVLMTILSVFFGWLATVIPRNIVYYTSTALFFIFGLKMLWEGYKMPPGGAQEEMDEVHADLRKRDDEIDKEVHLITNDPESGRRRRQNLIKLWSRIFLQAFTMTFLAEWGDRSQLTTIILAAREDIYGVMVGGVLGHSLCTGLAVLGGRFVAQKISVRTVTIIGGIVFLIFAISALIFNPLGSSEA